MALPRTSVSKAVAGVVLAWVIAGLVLEIASYLPFDPEWTLLATFALFGTTFFVGALGAFFMAPALTRFREWPAPVRSLLRWAGLVWLLYTAIWFVLVLTSPGQPVHCGTLGAEEWCHGYVFDNHGSLTATNRPGFLAGARVVVRLYASPPIALLSVILVAYRQLGKFGSGRAV